MKHTIVLLALGLQSLLLFGSQPAMGQNVDFFIETIRVEGPSPKQVATIEAELRLSEDTTYNEGDLRLAVSRVRRLPFVVNARFHLEKGTERGRFSLVVNAYVAHPFFFSFQAGTSRDGFEEEAEETTFSGIGAGYRMFLGENGGIVYGGLNSVVYSDQDNAKGSLEAGWAHYNLFSKNIFAALSISGETGGDQHEVTAELGLPLAAKHSLNFRLSHGEDNDVPTQESTQYSIAWRRDTRDDLVLAREGSLWQVEASGSTATYRDGFNTFEGEAYGLAASWLGYRPRAERSALFSTAGAAWLERDNAEGYQISGSARLGYRLGFGYSNSKEREWGWETSAGVELGFLEHASFGRDDQFTRTSLSSHLIFRSRWGVVRFGLSIEDFQ